MRTLLVSVCVCALAFIGGCDGRSSASGGGNSGAPPGSSKQVAGEKIEASLSAIQQYLQSGEISKAEAIARTLVARAPTEVRAYEMLGQVLIEKAGAAALRGDDAASADLKKLAWENYRKATELDSDNAGLLHSAGLMALTAGEQAAALDLFLKAETLDHSNPQFPLFAAQVFMQQKKLDEAEAALKRALAVAPDEPFVHASLAMLALERSDFETAHKEISIARNAEPESIDFRAQQAKIFRRQNRPREALELLIGLDEASRATEAVAFEIASAYETLGEQTKAAQAWVLCAQANPRSPTAFTAIVHAADLYLKSGNATEAARWINIAGQLRPEATEVQELRQRLHGASN